MMHQTNLGWATHVAHHSSEEYNLTVALRQGAFQVVFGIPFFLPLALIGFPWEVMLATGALNTVLQFWFHTRLVNKLPRWFEYVMNTPSHHRVHHGKNPKYIDKNHAGVLIIWDRMYGTFQPEEEEPVYGITTPLASWSPVWANLHFFAWIGRQFKGVRSLRDVWMVLFGPPGWRPKALGDPLLPQPTQRSTNRKWDVATTWGLRAYALLLFLSAMPLTLYTLQKANTLPPLQLLSAGLCVLLTLTSMAALLQRRSWAFWLEQLRLLMLGLVAVLGLLLGVGPVWVPLALLGFVLASALLVWRLQPQLTDPEPTPIPDEPALPA
jgi:hypothetical protein